jgi:DNA-binding LytR/AlgR family response regulator
MATWTRTTQPRALVAEDEANLRNELCALLASLWPELQICALAADGRSALQLWKQHQPDVVFLDIYMPGASGLEVAQQTSGLSHIVFVTAYDRHAIEAFEQGVVDYVLKPFDRARLAITVERLKARVHSTPEAVGELIRALSRRIGGDPGYLRWITASHGQETRLITSEEICFFRAEQKYTLVATADRDALISRPIKELVEVLDPAVFMQIHRATIVNVRHIAHVGRDFRGQMCVKLKHRRDVLTVSASHSHKLRQM